MTTATRTHAGKVSTTCANAAAMRGSPAPVTLMDFRGSDVGTPLEAFNWVVDTATWLNRLGEGCQPECRIGMQQRFDGIKLLWLSIRYDDGRQIGLHFVLGPTIHGQLPSSSSQIVVPDALDALHLAGMLIDAVGGNLLQVAELGRDANPAVWGMGRKDAIYGRVAPADHQRQPSERELVVQDSGLGKYGGNETFTTLNVFNLVANLVQQIRSKLLQPIREIHLAARVHNGVPAMRVMLVQEPQPHGAFESLDLCVTGILDMPKRLPLNKRRVDVVSLDQALHMVEMISNAMGVGVFVLGGRAIERNPLLWDRPKKKSSGAGHQCQQRTLTDHQRQRTVHTVRDGRW